MNSSLRIQHWVLWWIYIGGLCGAVAVACILGSDLTRIQERIILILGVLFWLQGGMVCYVLGGIKIEETRPPAEKVDLPHDSQSNEWHPASDFLFPGCRNRILPTKY